MFISFLSKWSSTLGGRFSPDNISLILFSINTHPTRTKGLKLNLSLETVASPDDGIHHSGRVLSYLPAVDREPLLWRSGRLTVAPLVFPQLLTFMLAAFRSRKTLFLKHSISCLPCRLPSVGERRGLEDFTRSLWLSILSLSAFTNRNLFLNVIAV